MLNKALRLLQHRALERCSSMRTHVQTAIPRQLNLPLRAFDELQELKRRHGFAKNADAIAYALFLAAAMDAAAGSPACPVDGVGVSHE